MSTRANIIIKDKYNDHLFFYRHSDGYPEGTLPSLKKFLDLLHTEGRASVSQGGGFLIVLGAIEYNSIPTYTPGKDFEVDWDAIHLNGWKVGAYEPTTGIHGDIEHLYVVDLDRLVIEEIEIPEESDDWTAAKVLKVYYQIERK